MIECNSPYTVKKNIIDWYREDNRACVDASSQNTQFNFALLIANTVIIYKQPHLPNRIYIQSPIDISPEHQNLIETKPEIKKNLIGLV